MPEDAKIIYCWLCGSKNRVPRLDTKCIPKCGACGESLPTTVFASFVGFVTEPAIKIARAFCAVAVILIPLWVVFLAFTKSDSSSPLSSDTERKSATKAGPGAVEEDPLDIFRAEEQAMATMRIEAERQKRRAEIETMKKQFKEPELPLPVNGEVFYPQEFTDELKSSEEDLYAFLTSHGLKKDVLDEIKKVGIDKWPHWQNLESNFTSSVARAECQGMLRRNSQLHNNFVAPLEIVAPAGTWSMLNKSKTDRNYLIKLTNEVTGATALTFFVHGGTTTKVKVPLGTYSLKYASGDKWYGHRLLFGPSTAYNKVSKTFTFKATNTGVTGYTITLYKVANGNLQTEELPPEDF